MSIIHIGLFTGGKISRLTSAPANISGEISDD